jgi:toxin ParE1/3/4
MRLRKTPAAEQDLLAVWEYIANDNPAAADRLWQRLADRFDDLTKNPFIGETQERFRPGLRSVVEGNYVVFYEPTSARREKMGGLTVLIPCSPGAAGFASFGEGKRLAVFFVISMCRERTVR